jgi:hypothetical protein
MQISMCCVWLARLLTSAHTDACQQDTETWLSQSVSWLGNSGHYHAGFYLACMPNRLAHTRHVRHMLTISRSIRFSSTLSTSVCCIRCKSVVLDLSTRSANPESARPDRSLISGPISSRRLPDSPVAILSPRLSGVRSLSVSAHQSASLAPVATGRLLHYHKGVRSYSHRWAPEAPCRTPGGPLCGVGSTPAVGRA